MMFFDATFLFMESGAGGNSVVDAGAQRMNQQKKNPHLTVLYQSAVKTRAFSKKGLGIFKCRNVADEE